jgi:hypothetical protein
LEAKLLSGWWLRTAANVSTPFRNLCVGRVNRGEFVAFSPPKPVDPNRFIRLKINSLRAAPAGDRRVFARKQIGFHSRLGIRSAAAADAVGEHQPRLTERP